jgi:hypothetical protein
VEYRGEADLDAQALGIGRNRARCLRGSFEQTIVDDGLVLVGDGGNDAVFSPSEVLVYEPELAPVEGVKDMRNQEGLRPIKRYECS